MTELADSVAETSVSTGVGSIVLAGAWNFQRAFDSAIADGDYYEGGKVDIRIDAVDENGNLNGPWEVTESTYTSSTKTLTRGVFRSSSTGSRIDFDAGAKVVTVVLSAYRIKNNVNDSPFASTYIGGGGPDTIYSGEVGRSYVGGGHPDSVFTAYIGGAGPSTTITEYFNGGYP